MSAAGARGEGEAHLLLVVILENRTVRGKVPVERPSLFRDHLDLGAMPTALRGHARVSRTACPRKAVGMAPIATSLSSWTANGDCFVRSQSRHFSATILIFRSHSSQRCGHCENSRSLG